MSVVKRRQRLVVKRASRTCWLREGLGGMLDVGMEPAFVEEAWDWGRALGSGW